MAGGVTGRAFYRRVGDGFVPTGLGVSPWAPDAQMGVGLAGLAAHAIAAEPGPVSMTTARLTIDILGAVPMVPLVPRTRVVRSGRRMQVVETELADGDRTWVRASALRVRAAASPAREEPPTRPFPAATPPGRPHWCEMIVVAGDRDTPGDGAAWVRITSALIEDEPLAPLEAAAMVADFGSGVAPLAERRAWTYANLDVSLHMTRLPQGDWLLIDAATAGAGNGMGIAHSRLSDRGGQFAVAHQTIFLAPR